MWRSAFAKKRTASTAANGTQVLLEELVQLRFYASQLELRQHKKLLSVMAGGKQSGFRGRGVDFVETRHYQAGDDIRALDWRVTARTGHPHTKLFREERERPVLILADYSPSMWFGTRVAFKSVIAARSAALLAWAAVAQGDRVGGLVYAPNQLLDIRPGGGRRGALRLLRALSQPLPAQASNRYRFSHALAQLRRVALPGSLICLLSDFQALDEDCHRHLSQLARHNDVLAVHIYDRFEQELPPPGNYPVTDGQRQFSLRTQHSALRERYRQQFTQHRNQLKQLFQQRGLRLLSLATDESVTDLLTRRAA